MANSIKSGYPDMMLLNNSAIVAYALDVPPTGGTHFSPLTKHTLKKYPECLIFWDPFSSNSIFSQTELTKDKILQDSTVLVLERYISGKTEYLLLHRNIQGVADWKDKQTNSNTQ